MSPVDILLDAAMGVPGNTGERVPMLYISYISEAARRIFFRQGAGSYQGNKDGGSASAAEQGRYSRPDMRDL